MAITADRMSGSRTNERFQAALALAGTGDAAGAIHLLERLHADDRKHPGVRNALGVLRLERGDVAGAIAMLKPLARELPNAAAIQLNLGNAMVAAGRAADAIGPLKRATSADASSVMSWYGLGRALQTAGRVAEAQQAYTQALRCAPEHVDTLANRAAAFNFLDHLAEGEADARAAIERAPTHAGAHFNLAVSLLAQRRWADAWAEYEWRERTTLLDGMRRQWPSPRWQGESVEGKTVLVYAEQGYGDTIQFLRYVPSLKAIGARVILAVPAALHDLIASATAATPAFADAVVRLDAPMPAHDCHVPLTGLPPRLRCASDVTVFAGNAPYLPARTSEAGSAPEMRLTRPLRVGLVWAGSGTHVNDMHRSCGLTALLSLAALPDIEWVSLQTGERALDLKAWPKRVPIIDLSPSLHDFADTADVLAGLDVVVSIDSAVAHLAGAMGRSCLLLLPRIGLDWRWAGVADGSASPWYASVRCLRQSMAGDWSSAVAQVRDALQAAAAERTSPTQHAA